MPKKRKAPPAKPSSMDKMVEECVKRAKARKRSGETDREWREQYAASLKVEGEPAPLSRTPFDGDAGKKKA